jgi:predicted transcriptional regulator
MVRTAREVTDAELAVLEELWRRESATVRELTEALYPGGGASETATVHKLCERLIGKNYVARDDKVRPYTFRATVDRAGLIGRHLENVADKLCAGSLTPLLTHLVDSVGLDADEARQLREYVERLDAGKGTGRRRGAR